jgi:hypothetical protein
VFALIPAAIPAGVKRVSAQIATRHNKAPVIDYAMLVLSKRRWIDFATLSLMNAAVGKGSGERFSGWTTLQADHDSKLNVLLDRPTIGACDLVLMTRPNNMKDGPADYAWARFFNIEVELDSSATPLVVLQG